MINTCNKTYFHCQVQCNSCIFLYIWCCFKIFVRSTARHLCWPRFFDSHRFSQAFGMSWYQKSGFSPGFWLGLLKLFDQSKLQSISDLINNVFVTFIHECLELLRIAQNPYFSSLSIWVFMIQAPVVSIIQWCNNNTPHCVSTEACTRRLRIHRSQSFNHLSNEFDLYVTFYIIPIYWIHWALKRSSNLSISMFSEAAISGTRYVIVRHL